MSFESSDDIEAGIDFPPLVFTAPIMSSFKTSHSRNLPKLTLTVRNCGSRSTFSYFSHSSFLLPDANLSLRLCSFSSVVSRLFELGVPTEQFVTTEPWIMPTIDEQATKKD